MDIICMIIEIIGGLLIGIGLIIGAFMLNWIFGIIITGLVLIIFGGILYETWLES